MSSQSITGADRTRIAGEAICCERTVRRVYDGGGNHWSRARVAAAAQRLGLPLPPTTHRGHHAA